MFFRQKCDSFSRSSDAVFELSTRFAEPFVHSGDTEAARERERLMFLELAQGGWVARLAFFLVLVMVMGSVSVGKRDRLESSH